MATVTGTVEAMSAKSAYGTYGMLVDGKWYNSKFPMKAEKGDEVTFDDGGKNYVNKLKVVGGAGGGTAPKTTPKSSGGYSRGKFPVEKDDGQIAIIRQNALTNAINLIIHSTGGKVFDVNDETVATIIGIARTFESYTSGDVDREAAKRMEFDPE